MVDIKTLKQLIKLMVDNDLTELDIEAEGGPVKLKRNSQNPGVQSVPVAVPMAPAVAAVVQPAPSASPDTPASDEATGPTVVSPMVGTFYTASSPEAKPFVSVGDRVTPDTVVCIIEAMKVFNEIKAEIAGTIEKVLVETGQAVEFDQPLFAVKPD